nr:hypothetical protein [Xylanimonas cellulosilytica]
MDVRPVFLGCALLVTPGLTAWAITLTNPAWPRYQRVGLGVLMALGILLVLVGIGRLLLLAVDVADRRSARAHQFESDAMTARLAERIPASPPARLNLAAELGHTDERTLASAPVLVLHGDGTLTLEATPATADWAGTYDLRTVRKVINFLCLDPIPGGSSETAVVFYTGVPRNVSALFALDTMWLSLPEVREYLSTYIPAGIRNDFDHSWRPRPRTGPLVSEADRRATLGRYPLISNYGVIRWDHPGGPTVTVSARPSAELCVTTRASVAEVRSRSWFAPAGLSLVRGQAAAPGTFLLKIDGPTTPD